jgi:hypothetical protein
MRQVYLSLGHAGKSDDGKKSVKQIIFEGERLDALSVRRWREKVLRLGPL